MILEHGSATSAVVTDLTPGQVYQFKVKASSLVGDSPWSPIAQILIAAKPTAPFNLLVKDFDNTFVTLTWSMPLSNGGQNLLGYKIYRKDCSASDNDATLLQTLSASEYQFTDSTVVGGTQYAYFVTAFNERGGESQPSLTVEVNPITVPSKMDSPTRVTHNLNSITLAWTTPTSDGDSDILEYHLWMRPTYQAAYEKVYSGSAKEQKIDNLQAGFSY